jgi:IclR family pca regulon transcriptional regulator
MESENKGPTESDGKGRGKADLVGGFLKGLKVIESFDSDRRKQSIADISRSTGLDRATCRRLLLSLVHAGYASHDGKLFWLSPRSLRLGYAYLHSSSLSNTLQGYLEQLSSDIHESCSGSVLQQDHVVYIARAAYQRVMSINLRIGSRLPIYCSSMGRVLLASLPVAEARRLLDATDLVKLTPNTCVDIDELMRELDTVRKQDYAIVDEELEVGLRSVAVPVRNNRGQVLAAINIGTNAARVPFKRLIDQYLPKLRAIQTELSGILAHE